MKQSITHRSLSNKRNFSQNQSSENLDAWDNIGLLNNRLTSFQQFRTPVFKKYQGDKILQHKRKSTYDDSQLLPQIDMSLKINSSSHHNQVANKKNHAVFFQSPLKKEVKSDKIKLLVMLSQLKKEYQKNKKPSQTVCLLLQEVLEILQKQENIYGEDMKAFFSIINEMIFCVQQDVIQCISRIQVSTENKLQDNLVIKPYFEYINIMMEEIERHNQNSINFQKKLDKEISQYQSQIKQSEVKLYAIGESQKQEIEQLKKIQTEETHLMQLQINNIQEELQRAIKENSIVRESNEKWKSKFEDEEKKFIEQIQQTQEYKIKFENIKSQYESCLQQIENLEIENTQIKREKYELEEKLALMTPRPKLHSHNFFDQMGIPFNDFESISTVDKVEKLKEKLEEKMNELIELHDQQNKKQLKKKGSKILGVFVQTKRQSSTVEDKLGITGGSKQSLDKSPTRKKQNDIKAKLDNYSPQSPLKITIKDSPSMQLNQSALASIKRSAKKSSTQVDLNKYGTPQEKNNQSYEEYENLPQLKIQTKSQVLLSQPDQISNFSVKSRQSDERRVQFKQQTSESEQDSPNIKLSINNNRFSNIS
ncbi:hypothetical protein TTHERM_00312100 (macronuclear) [Tetrahymena thermophila SB210]|uniref:Uncharacterized protein n=1 Tax=Tetrahymena thermophila (strain SB210) TaxID=312017 RepID=Q22KS0_TETTS|nr:hypothetical protein TTHERM_00312100 [Tetrahymena thermophila SB210]EAR85729.2 hypothetical protein TTHERM_00312100 [Tetrahymena thermophila SB210]|eukprot:XP_001033392.2 hypothetical protein TTHERM_00312100 [Tetrahymena thermophila SB210]